MHRLREQRGQATIEYVAVIALLAVLLTVTASLTGLAPGIVNATLGQFRRALCIVRGGDCPVATRQPCTVASTRKAGHFAVSFILRYDDDSIVLRERLSDGSVRLTVSDSEGLGATGGFGARAELKLKGRTIGFEREAFWALEGVLGNGHVYLARNDHDADEILDALHSGVRFGPNGMFHLGGHSAPPPQSDFVEGGIRGLGHVGGGVALAGGSLDGVGDAILGASHNRKTGQVTITLNAGATGSGMLGAMLLGHSGSGDRHTKLMLTLDRHGSPQQLSVEATEAMTSGGTLPPELAKEAGSSLERSLMASSSDMTGRIREVTAQVDLHDRDVAAAWKAFWRHPTSSDAIHALGTILRDESQLSVSTYATDTDVDGIAGGVAFAAKVGGELSHTVDRARLLSAAIRPPGGLWEQRFDCVPV